MKPILHNQLSTNRKILFVVLLAIIFGLNTDSASAQCFTPLSFGVPTNITTSGVNTPRGIVSGDFNGDGKMDVAVANLSSTNITVYLGTGTGTFSPGVNYASNSSQPYGITSGDFNGDGIPDLATCNNGGVNVSIYTGLGNGTFSPGVVVTGTSLSAPRTIISGDFNGDGKSDLAVGNNGSNYVTIMINNGSGGFISTNVTTSGGPFSLVVSDFNSDGKPDLACANTGSGGTVSVLFNNGSGGFSSVVTSVVTDATGLAVGDFDGDGHADDLAAFSYNHSYMTILLGNNSGGFVNLGTTAVPANPQWGISADFNNDGHADIAIGSSSGNQVMVFYGNGAGVFTSSVSLTSGIISTSEPIQELAVDLNNDGRLDIVAANAGNSDNDNTVTSWLNTDATASAASTSPLCASGSNTTLTLTGGPASMTSYAWSGPNGFTSSLQNPPSITNAPTAYAGIYTLTVVNSGSCTATATVNVRIADPTVVATASSPVCTNSSLTLSGITSSGISSYSWTGPNTYTSSAQNNSISNPTTAASGVYTLKVTDVFGCTNSANTTSVTVKTGPKTSQSFNLCAGQSVTVGAHTYNATGTYTDNLTAANGCDSVVTTSVTVFFGSGNATFATAAAATGGNGPRRIVSQDFNNDGKLDLAICDLAGSAVTIDLGNGSGGFTQAAGSPITVGGQAHYLNYGDFNGDGNMDLVTANYSTSSITILLGNGSGGFPSVTTLSGGSYGFNNCRSVVSGDFNGDGKADLAVGNYGGNTVSILLGNGNGTFTVASPATVAAGSGPYTVHTGDFNNDGKTDLVMVTTGSTTATLLLGNGNGTFAAATFPPVGGSPYGCVVGDFNNDGNLDLGVLLNGASMLEVLIGNGSGGFSTPTPYACPTGPQWGSVADFNGDGNPDIAVGAQTTGTIDVFYGTGTGTFGSAVSYPASTQAIDVVAADFNGDGKPDMASANNTANNASILLNSTQLATASASSPVCTSGTGSTLTLTGGGNGLSSYTWSGPNSYSSSLQSPVITSPTTASAGIYTITVTESHGCSSTATTAAVVIKSAKTYTQTISACGSYTIGIHTYTSNGTYTDVLSTTAGCDSTVTTNLTIKNNSITDQTINICAGQSATVGTHTYNATGTYTDNLTAANGCDSVVTTSVTVFFGSGNATFATAAAATGGNGPRRIVSQDFNNDGKLDLAICDLAGSAVTIDLGNGSGGFTQAAGSPITVGGQAHYLNYGDFNGDGNMDLVTANYSTSSITILLGNGSGGFPSVTTLSGGSYGFNNCRSVVSGDFNGDGKADLAVGNYGGNTVSILLGNGNGTFTVASPATVAAGSGPYTVHTGDFNNDGKTDLVMVTTGSTTATLLLGNGNGTFAAATFPPVGGSPYGCVVGDFNNDGNLDLGVLLNGASMLEVLIGNGSGGFSTPTPYACPTGPQWGSVADFNGDGNPDIAVGAQTTGTIDVFYGTGTGTFGSAVSYPASTQAIDVVAADFNGDGKPDMASANNTANNASILLNSTQLATASASSPVCTSGTGSTLTLTGGGNGLSSYTWSGPNSYSSSLQSPVITSPTTTVAGIYTLTVSESHGCTGTANTVSVVVNSATSFNQTVTACGSLTVGATKHTASGTFTDVLSSSKGCDSTVITNLTILPLKTFSQSVSICAGQSITIGTATHTYSGTYVDHLTAANSCDSAVTTKLTVLWGNGGNGTFSTATPATGGNGPRAIVTADFNGDGKLDLAISDLAGSTVTIDLGNGSGGFTQAAGSPITVGGQAHYINYGDFNGDGKIDLVTTNYSTSTVSILLGNGAGGFTVTNLSQATGSFADPRSVAIADFNGDGNADIAVANNNNGSAPGTVSVLFGNGSGGFTLNATYTTAISPYDIHTVDINNDGFPDLAMATGAVSAGAILFNNGTGVFSSMLTPALSATPYGCIPGDFNGDGKIDLAFALNGASQLDVLLGNGNGTFQSYVPYSCPTNPQWGVAADFNGDGFLDIAVGAQTTGTADVFYGTGTGTFGTAVSYTAGTQAIQVAAGDFNGDGKMDMAIANNGASNATILLNSMATLAAPASANASTPICPNATLSLTGGPAGLSNYSWSGPNFYGATGQSPVLNGPGTAGAGIYTLTVTDSRGCTGTANTPAVVMNPLPPVAVSPASAVCTGLTNAILSASGAVSYTWSPTGNLTPSAGTSATETAQISQLTFYTVSGIGSNGCSNTTVVPVATVATGGAISPAFSIICSGNTQTLTVTGEAGHDYQWQISQDNINWTNITGATNTTYTTASGDGNTNEFYRLMAQSNSCWNVASTTGEVDVSNPNIVVTATNITDNSLTLNWSPTGTGNYSISYSGTSSATFTSVTPAKTITGLTANSTYSITVTQTGVSGCPASGTITGVTTLCAMPTGVTLSSPAPAQIQVSWTGIVGADYRVYYRPLFSYNTYFTKDVSNVSGVLLTKQGANNLYASTTYEVYVSRLDCPTTGAVGQGTNPTNVTTLPTVTCATPVIDSVRSLCPVQIEVFIHDNGVNQYNVFIQRLTPSILAVNSYGVSGTYFTINTPYSGDQYLIAVEAKCGSALSSLYVWPGNVTIKPLCSSPNNLVLSNPTCHGFTASWNADQCLSNSASGYDLYMRVAGTINYNSYGVNLPGNGIGPNKLINWLTSGRTYQVFVRSVYNCNGFVTYGPTSEVETITTLSSGCRDEDAEQSQENKTAMQQYSPDNSEVFSLYPNPNTGKFVVDLSRLGMEENAVRIEVFNMLGQTVLTNLTTISGGHMSEYINLPNGTAAGTYIIRLTEGRNVYTAKINISK